jgi:hypothetical protein
LIQGRAQARNIDSRHHSIIALSQGSEQFCNTSPQGEQRADMSVRRAACCRRLSPSRNLKTANTQSSSRIALLVSMVDLGVFT